MCRYRLRISSWSITPFTPIQPIPIRGLAHLDQYEKSFGNSLKSLTADAGYGSEENYTLLEEKQIAAYVKYGLFDKRQNKSFNKKHSVGADKLIYNPDSDHHICLTGQKMHYIGNKTNRTTTGFIQSAGCTKPAITPGAP